LSFRGGFVLSKSHESTPARRHEGESQCCANGTRFEDRGWKIEDRAGAKGDFFVCNICSKFRVIGSAKLGVELELRVLWLCTGAVQGCSGGEEALQKRADGARVRLGG
jgi:hypothetical protein